MKFRNRLDAGNALARRLAQMAGQATVVVGIPRGGVILAEIVASNLSSEFDIVVPRKLGAPDNKELAIGAVTEDGTSYINRYVVDALRIKPSYIEQEKSEQMNEIKRRSSLYRKPDPTYRDKVKGKNVILVDDGIATGATVIASARWLKKHGSRHLTIAVPVAPIQTVEVLREEADSVVVLQTPDSFGAVGEFYEEFEVVSDNEVVDIMRKHNLV